MDTKKPMASSLSLREEENDKESPKTTTTRETPSEAIPLPLKSEPTRVPSTSPAIAAAPADLTPGAAEFLARLTPDQRARFDATPPKHQAKRLTAFAAGYDANLAQIFIADLPQPKSAPEERPMAKLPPTTAALLEQLPGGPAEWVHRAAEIMVQDFGAKKDRKLWGQIDLICRAVWRGALALDPVLNAYNQAMESDTARRKKRLDPIENRGAKFWKALQLLADIRAEDLPDLAAGM
jgi:hypothetical protein